MGTGIWSEFQLRWKESQPYDPNEVFKFKKERLLPLFDELGVGYWFTLDEPDWVLIRLIVDSDAQRELVKQRLESLIAGASPFARVTVDVWSPEDDARRRIVDALGRLKQAVALPSEFKGPGWHISGQWPVQVTGAAPLAIGEQDLDEKTRQFASFMAEVAGKFTEAYLRAMPDRIDDRWLKSVFVHLLLNSISTPMNIDGGGEEREIRYFPAI